MAKQSCGDRSGCGKALEYTGLLFTFDNPKLIQLAQKAGEPGPLSQQSRNTPGMTTAAFRAGLLPRQWEEGPGGASCSAVSSAQDCHHFLSSPVRNDQKRTLSSKLH